jgi:hypothetical protein
LALFANTISRAFNAILCSAPIWTDIASDSKKSILAIAYASFAKSVAITIALTDFIFTLLSCEALGAVAYTIATVAIYPAIGFASALFTHNSCEALIADTTVFAFVARRKTRGIFDCFLKFAEK